MTTEYRLVCARHGTAGHGSHWWQKRDRRRAVQSKIDADHHAQMHPTSYYSAEAPYRIEQRTVTAWEPLKDSETDL